MAYEESIRSITLDADASLGAYTGVPGLPGSADPNGGKQYHVVKVTGAHTVGVVSAVTDDVVGVVQNKPQTVGAAATVAIRGATRVVSDAAITAGSAVYVSADGQATSDSATGTATRLGTALTTTSAAGELVVVLLKL